MRRAAAPLLAFALGAGCIGGAWAQNPSLSDDYKAMMGWLSNEVVQGLAFNAGSTFDPPHELPAWKLQPDISVGLGSVPLDKAKFPKMSVPALAEKNPTEMLPNDVRFPNLTLHMRFGLPGRMDLSLRGAGMTVPKGHSLAPGTQGDGQSSTLGLGARKHFFGGDDDPLLSLGLNYNHVRGHFNFLNRIQYLQLLPGYTIDAVNTGRLEWNVNSFGGNAVVSQTFGAWTPFVGGGLNYMTGSVKARLQSDFATALISPAVGEASAKPEAIMTRFIFGVQMDHSRFGLFLNGEVKTSGASAGKTFIVSTGVAAPFRFGASRLSARTEEGSRVAYRPPGAEALRKREDDAHPELLFLQ